MTNQRAFISTIAGIIGLFGFCALIGWQFDIAVLKMLPPGKVSMNPLTAVCFILMATALLSPGRLSKSCAGLALFLGLSRVLGIVGFDLELDRLFYVAELGTNRMAPNTALCFSCAAGALLWRRISDALILICFSISIFALTGYVYGVQALYGVSTFIPMALNTGIAFLLLSLGLFAARIDQGIAAAYLKTDMGGTLIRRQFPIVIFTPLILGALYLSGQRANLYDPEVGVALLVVCSMLVLAYCTWKCSRYLSRLDRAFQEQAAKLHSALSGELSVAESKVQQLQKLDAIGRLAGGIAHDFNNILGIIQIHCDLIKDPDTGPEHTSDGLKEIEQATQRGANLTRQLLVFSRTKVEATAVLDLSAVIKEHLKMLRALIGENISIEFKPSENLWPVEADAGQVEQIVMNLVINSRDAMPNGGKIKIELLNENLTEEFANAHLSTNTGPHVQLRITDNGTGMDAATKSRIFEPFFTTKAVGKGTGLGLATVFGIVKTYGGTIWVYSEIGKGTVFNIYFPATEKSLTVESSETGNMKLFGKERILLAEDEAKLRELYASALRKHGFNVVTCENGAEALSMLEKEGGKFDLILTDMIMPVMGGAELVQHVSGKFPAMKVVCMSGFPGDASSAGLLHKPFNTKTLIAKIREQLDS